MQGNSTMQKIIRTAPRQQHGKPEPRHAGKQWQRTDKREALPSFSQR